jgi:hypothetical protein
MSTKTCELALPASTEQLSSFLRVGELFFRVRPYVKQLTALAQGLCLRAASIKNPS